MPAEKKSSPRCQFNQEIYDKFNTMKANAQHRGIKNQEHCYGKVIRVLEKYPIPILSSLQASNIEGIGPKIANVIDGILSKKYKDHFKGNNSIFVNKDSNASKESLKEDDLKNGLTGC